MSKVLLQHFRNILVEFFADKIVYTIPKYVPDEKTLSSVVEVRDLPDKIEIVFTKK
jgi:hypothetical protein